MSLRKIFANTITDLSNKDPRLVTIVGDISHGIFADLRAAHPNRYFNIGICEPSMIGLASGLASQGLIPVVHTITPFLIERAYEQIKLDFAYQRLGVNLVSVGGSFEYSKLGCTHHCYSDFSLLSKFPNTQIFFPGSNQEFQQIFLKNYNNGLINYYRLTEFPHNIDLKIKEIDRSSIALYSGNDFTMIVCGGPSLSRAVSALDKIRAEGFTVDLFYCHTLKPFDHSEIYNSIKRTRKFIVIEENHQSDSLFKLILATIQGNFTFRCSSLNLSDFVREYGSYEYLTGIAGIDSNNIYEACKSLLALKAK